MVGKSSLLKSGNWPHISRTQEFPITRSCYVAHLTEGSGMGSCVVKWGMDIQPWNKIGASKNRMSYPKRRHYSSHNRWTSCHKTSMVHHTLQHTCRFLPYRSTHKPHRREHTCTLLTWKTSSDLWEEELWALQECRSEAYPVPTFTGEAAQREGWSE